MAKVDQWRWRNGWRARNVSSSPLPRPCQPSAVSRPCSRPWTNAQLILIDTWHFTTVSPLIFSTSDSSNDAHIDLRFRDWWPFWFNNVQFNCMPYCNACTLPNKREQNTSFFSRRAAQPGRKWDKQYGTWHHTWRNTVIAKRSKRSY